ncbi:hypothetical protein [Aurantiacibacter odishensis]|uniref:hypothetical protein n=1 Tax=Aurantiacibacter odishensis TaxID=1155476 RepID=UPI001F0BB92A|nr:hypothetical protein [Aurantiacibacter odishensis]
MQEIKRAGCQTKIVRDGQIPSEDWERIVVSGNIQIALTGGTVRLEGSSLREGIPSVMITGISFSEAALVKVLDRYCVYLRANITKQSGGCNAQAMMECAHSSTEAVEPHKEVLQPIRPGDPTASVAQTEQATGLGRTTIDKLMREGPLVRKKVGRRTLVTVESIERLFGAKVAR